MKNVINLDIRNKITHSPLYLMITFAKLIFKSHFHHLLYKVYLFISYYL